MEAAPLQTLPLCFGLLVSGTTASQSLLRVLFLRFADLFAVGADSRNEVVHCLGDVQFRRLRHGRLLSSRLSRCAPSALWPHHLAHQHVGRVCCSPRPPPCPALEALGLLALRMPSFFSVAVLLPRNKSVPGHYLPKSRINAIKIRRPVFSTKTALFMSNNQRSAKPGSSRSRVCFCLFSERP